MKKSIVLGLAWMILLIVGFSTDIAQGATTVGKPAKEKLAVLDLEAKYGVEKNFAEGLSVIIRDEIHSFGDYEVMSREDLQAVASQEQLKQAIGCDEGGQCLIDFGRAIGTRFMVVGSVSKYGATYTISLRMLDTKGETAGVVNRENMSCKCAEDDLIVTSQTVAAKLMGKESSKMIAAKATAEKERIALEKSKVEKAEKEKAAIEQFRLADEKKKAQDTEEKRLALEKLKIEKSEKENQLAEKARKEDGLEREKKQRIDKRNALIEKEVTSVKFGGLNIIIHPVLTSSGFSPLLLPITVNNPSSEDIEVIFGHYNSPKLMDYIGNQLSYQEAIGLTTSEDGIGGLTGHYRGAPTVVPAGGQIRGKLIFNDTDKVIKKASLDKTFAFQATVYAGPEGGHYKAGQISASSIPFVVLD
ncbi:MAG: hypothetical protein V2B20_15780 [Pseudomonadota bacterium]